MGKSCQVVGEHGMQSDGKMPGTGRSGALPVEAGAGRLCAGRRSVARTDGFLTSARDLPRSGSLSSRETDKSIIRFAARRVPDGAAANHATPLSGPPHRRAFGCQGSHPRRGRAAARVAPGLTALRGAAPARLPRRSQIRPRGPSRAAPRRGVSTPARPR